MRIPGFLSPELDAAGRSQKRGKGPPQNTGDC